MPNDFQQGNSEYKLYQGTISKIEIYTADEDTGGKLKQERRKEVKAEELTRFGLSKILVS